jgi:Thiol-activated cytolysin
MFGSPFPVLIQSKFGRQGNFELMVPAAGEGVDHFWRNNDAAGTPWVGPSRIAEASGQIGAVTLIQSNFGSPGNLEIVVRAGDNIHAYSRDSNPALQWSGPIEIGSGARGDPVLVQSKFGQKGNFELAVPSTGGGIDYYWRDNDDPNFPWRGPINFGQSSGAVNSLTMIQSNYGSPGNMELIARVGDKLHSYWRDSGPAFQWTGPTEIASNARGNPILLQGKFGQQGNFELAVPSTNGGIDYYWRNNDSINTQWSSVTNFGRASGVVEGIAMIQSNFGVPGSLELVLCTGSEMHAYWRDSGPNFIWNGPNNITYPVQNNSIIDYLFSLGEYPVQSGVDRIPLPSGTISIEGILYNIQNEAVKFTNSTEKRSFIDDTPEDVIWPGAVLQGNGISDSRFALVPLPRAAGTIAITTDLVLPAGTPRTPRSVRVADPSASNVTQARMDLLTELNPISSAGSFGFDTKTARTLEHGFVKLGLSFKQTAFNLDIDAKLDVTYATNTVIAYLIQVFYTVIFEPDTSNSPFFSPNVSITDLKYYTGPGNPPVYISSVKYGRLAHVIFTANTSNVKLEGAVKAAIDVAKLNVTISGEYENIINTSNIRILERGSTGELGLRRLIPSAGLSNYSSFVEYARGGGADFSLNNPGAAIIMEMKYLGSRRPAAVSLTTQYSETVGLSAPEVSGNIDIADGWLPVGGPRSTQVLVAKGDKVHVSADGLNWSGHIGSRLYGPDGHPQSWWAGHPLDTTGFPLPDENPFALIAGFDQSSWQLCHDRDITVSYPGAGPKQLWFGTNDSDPYNGDNARMFAVSYTITRKSKDELGGYDGIGRS